MVYRVAVLFGKGREYEYLFSDNDLAGHSAEEARRWLDGEYKGFACEPTSPVGKVLIIDKILSVANSGGERRFIDRQDWSTQFARNAALALGRDFIRIDVADSMIGY